jgi:hypothetical protein
VPHLFVIVEEPRNIAAMDYLDACKAFASVDPTLLDVIQDGEDLCALLLESNWSWHPPFLSLLVVGLDLLDIHPALNGEKTTPRPEAK